MKIADNAENRSVVKVAFALTEVSPVKEVVLDEMTDPITVEDESCLLYTSPSPRDCS